MGSNGLHWCVCGGGEESRRREMRAEIKRRKKNGVSEFPGSAAGCLAVPAPKEARPCDSSQTRFLQTSKRDAHREKMPAFRQDESLAK